MGITKALLYTKGNKPLERHKWLMQQTEGDNWIWAFVQAGRNGIQDKSKRVGIKWKTGKLVITKKSEWMLIIQIMAHFCSESTNGFWSSSSQNRYYDLQSPSCCGFPLILWPDHFQAPFLLSCQKQANLLTILQTQQACSLCICPLH